MLRYLCIIGVALTFLSACSKSDSGQSKPRGSSEPKPIPSSSKNLAIAQKLKGQFYWDSCDEMLQPTREEIAKTLDEKMPWLRESVAAQSLSPSNILEDDEVKIGDFIFIKETARETSSDWTTASVGWNDVAKLYWKATTALDWARVLAGFNSLIERDHKRLVYEINFGIGPGTELEILKLYDNLLSCDRQNLESCLNSTSQKTLDANFNFKKIWEYTLRQRQESRMDGWRVLVKEIKSAWQRQFGFRPNPLVRREGNNFILPIRTKDYEKIKPELKSIIEKYWTLEDQKVIVEWTNDPMAYEILMPEQYVNPVTYPDSRKVLIYPGAPLEAFPHELGHVLGLPDDYFVRWDRSKCRYTTELQKGNLMSLAEGGHSLKKHFEIFNEYYH